MEQWGIGPVVFDPKEMVEIHDLLPVGSRKGRRRQGILPRFQGMTHQ
jgi:hypothetical protein